MKFLAYILAFISLTTFANTTPSIVFIGDSLTEGYGVKKAVAYPVLVGEMVKKAGKPHKIINAGISGSTTASALSRVKWFLKSKPSIILIALGANDGLRGIDVESTFSNLDKAISFAIEKDIKVILGGMYLPKNYGKKYTTDFKNVFIRLEKKHKLPFIPFMLKDVGGIAELNIDDGIHPNDKGHKIIAKTVFKYMEPLL